MSSNIDFGLLVTSPLNTEANIGEFYSLESGADDDSGDKEAAEKALKDAKAMQSLWFVNFPSKDAATAGSKQLGDFMQDVDNYRCWASGVWNKTVQNHPKMPKDNTYPSISQRNAFLAKVAVKHMKETPWLAISAENECQKNISCKTTQFHLALVENVLEGFVNVTPSVFVQLEAILKSLSKTTEVSTGSDETRTLVCQKFEYISEADTIRSYLRIVSFRVSDKVKEIHRAKVDYKTITCDIEYMDYEALFNRSIWQEHAKSIRESQMKASKDFVKKSTVDCDP